MNRNVLVDFVQHEFGDDELQSIDAFISHYDRDNDGYVDLRIGK
jgi:hypothetical protein